MSIRSCASPRQSIARGNRAEQMHLMWIFQMAWNSWLVRISAETSAKVSSDRNTANWSSSGRDESEGGDMSIVIWL